MTKLLQQPKSIKISNNDLSAILIALTSGASLFFYSPAFLIVFAAAAFASTGSVRLSKNLRHLIWTIVIFSFLAAASSLLSETQQHIPFILLWCAVSIVFCITFSSISVDVICRAILVFYLAFVVFEFNVIWMFFKGAAGDPITLVRSLDSPVMVVPNDFAYFTVFLPLLFLAFRHFFHGFSVKFLLASSLILFLTVSLILESRLAFIGAVILVGSEISGRLEGKYRSWIILSVFLVTPAVFALVLQKGIASLETRLTLWIAAVSGILESPLLGNGFDTFGSYYDQFKATGLQTLPITLSVDQRYVPWPHNIFLELVFSFGLSGILPIVVFFRNMVNYIRRGVGIDATTFQLVLILSLLALVEMSLLRIQTIPIFLIVWLSLLTCLSSHKILVRKNELV